MIGRRDWFARTLSAGLLAAAATRKARAASRFTMPGPFRGRVVSVHHPNSIASGAYQAGPVRDMIARGMMDLTGAGSATEAWRYFFEPGDVVGIKLNPVGRPAVISAPEVLHEIVSGLGQAGVKARDIVCYDRYHTEFQQAGFDKWLPDGVRWTAATVKTHPFQLDMDGYDRDQYMEMALVEPKADKNDAHFRRSYVAKFLTKEVNKVINLCLLKHHQSAGVTLALKNLSHGLVNNVRRSHATKSLNACGIFIPAVVELPVIREKCILHILDGVQGAYHGGPGRKVEKYVWEHKTMYFATDPVAMDRVGWDVIDAQRAAVGMKPVALAEADADSTFVKMQPEHVEIAGALGLGEFDTAKIDLRKVRLS
ncbi:MAG: DUF362 domain-containing protein [Bryobacterales bacterium]|nr:DUF362 domain-containing protein [Bryobacterales bacterium]